MYDMSEGNENVGSPEIKVKQGISPLVYPAPPSSSRESPGRSHDKIQIWGKSGKKETNARNSNLTAQFME